MADYVRQVHKRGLGKRLDPTLQLNEAALPYLAEALGMTDPATV